MIILRQPKKHLDNFQKDIRWYNQNHLKSTAQKCGFEKTVQFKSNCLGAGDFKQIPQICPKCGNENL